MPEGSIKKKKISAADAAHLDRAGELLSIEPLLLLYAYRQKGTVHVHGTQHQLQKVSYGLLSPVGTHL